MKVDLSKLFVTPGGRQELSCALDLRETKRLGRPLFLGPVRVSGAAENRSGVVSVGYTADFTLNLACDRCLTPLVRPERMEFSHTVVLSLNREENDEFIVVSDGLLDLAELVNADILLELPTSVVCGEDCKGLCPICGHNLNEGDCGCDRSVPDRRFDKLRELLSE